MKLSRRLLSLLLVCFLCFGLFSVNAFAVDDVGNLIDSDIRNWQEVSDLNSQYTPFALLDLETIYGIRVYRIGWKKPSSESVLTSHAIFTIPNLYVGDNYTLKFRANVSNISDLTKASWHIGIGYIDPTTNEPVSPEGSYITLTEENMSGAIGNSYDETSYKEIVLNFTHKETLGQPCIFIQGTLLDNKDSSSWISLRILENSFILTRDVNETDNKLDGILGWLEDIKNSIVGLPETIKNNFQTFFSDLENKINDFKNAVAEKFTTLSTEFSSYITNLGNNIKGFFDDFWNKISDWFEKFKPRINVDLGFQSGALNVSTGEFIFPAGNSYVLSDVIFVPDGVEMHLNYTPINDIVMRYIPVTSDGEYTGRYDQYYTDIELLLDTSRYFRIETRSYATSFIECYVDVGWFTYYMYTLRHKIDVKIEEIKQDLHDLFIPSEGYFNDLSNRFDLLIEERFGALVTITDYLVDFFSSFNADITKEFFDVPIININLMGYNFPIGGWQVRFVPQFNGVEILTNACKFISSVLATFAFFDGLKNKYHEVFGGGE